MSLSFAILDVFTKTKFSGNQLAIVRVPSSTELHQEQKQLIAREFNFSETVFLYEPTELDRQKGDVRISIFTPWAEINFAGHPAVGTAVYLLRNLKDNQIYVDAKALQTRAGRVPIELTPDSIGIQLKVAHNVHIHHNPFADTSFASHPVVSIVKGMTFILAAVPSLEELAQQTVSLIGADNEYTVSHKLDGDFQEGLVASYFYCHLGIKNSQQVIRTRCHGCGEDPATGSAASALCSYLSLTQEGSLSRKYHLTQGVEMGRRSDIFVEVTLHDDGKSVKEVLLSGSAVQVTTGSIDIPEL